MMKKLSMLAAATAALALTGCKSGIELPVNYTDLVEDAKIKTVELYVEIPSCTDYKTKLESSSLLEAKQKVLFAVDGAEYKTCKRDRFDEFAVFSVPVSIGRHATPTKTGLQVYLSANNAMVFFVGEDVRKKVNQLMAGGRGFDPKDFEIRFFFKNDSGTEFIAYMPSGFGQFSLDSEIVPIHDTTITLPNGNKCVLTLSNAASASAMYDGIAAGIRFDKE